MEKDLVPQPYQPYSSWEWGLQIGNYKKIDTILSSKLDEF